MDPTRRLLFWLRIPYVADAALLLIGVGFVLGGNGVGWWVVLFAAVRAAVGTIALVVIAPRVLAARADASRKERGDGRQGLGGS